MNKIMLWRPVNKAELDLIEQSDFKAFPPRLPQQPIFYPVCNKEYADELSKWNVQDYGKGYVVEFEVSTEFLNNYDRHVVGSNQHEEYWIPAEDLVEFNSNIVGQIKVVSEHG